jgi:anti-sigma B factor antagonist
VRDLTLDLSGLDFLDSTGVRLVVEAADAARRRGGTLRLRPGREEVQRVFRVTGLEDVLPFDAAR